jgi:phosphoribosylglycinamide formyltransferase-1
MNSAKVIRIAVFASGGGSNALEIFKHFKNMDAIDVSLCVTNKKDAGVLSHAKNFQVERVVFKNEDFLDGNLVLSELKEHAIDFIVLAGFLRKVPTLLTDYFEDRIINIHPALLPKYGGKGMYGMNVHRAVKENRDEVSGPTIHLVNDKFDDGAILAQFETELSDSDRPEDIARKVLELEHQYFAKVIEAYVLQAGNNIKL